METISVLQRKSLVGLTPGHNPKNIKILKVIINGSSANDLRGEGASMY
jgi:hypothetical protein